MKAKSIFLILIALGCGRVASIGISQVMRGGNEPTDSKQIEMTKIYVALNNLDISDKLAPENVQLVEYPSAKLPDGAITKWDNLKGKYARTWIAKGQAILTSMIMEEPGLDIIPQGYRAMPIKVSADMVSGLVKPGDRVDIMVILRAGSEVKFTTARTVLHNVRLLAVNDQIERVTEGGETHSVKTVNVIVKPEQALKLFLAMDVGKLRLSLRRGDETINDGDDAIDLRTLIGGGSQEADEKPTTPPPDESQPKGDDPESFMGLVQSISQNESQPTPKKPQHVMTVHTPEGVQQYVWNDLNDLPVINDLTNTGGSVPAAAAPQAAPQTPPQQPTPAPAPVSGSPAAEDEAGSDASSDPSDEEASEERAE